MESFEPLNLEAISAGTPNKILVFKSAASTNDIAWEYAASENDRLAVFAEQQTAGRGRRGNNWQSTPSQGILCSILLQNLDLSAEMISTAVAVATAEAINQHCQLNAKIKWPNDILIAGKKLAGILVESKTFDTRRHYVIGIGINCHQTKDSFNDADLKLSATSIDIESDSPTDRNQLSKQLLLSLENWLTQAKNNPTAVTAQWKNLCCQLGQTVTVAHNGQNFTGTCTAADPIQGITLKLPKNQTKTFPAATTTVIK